MSEPSDRSNAESPAESPAERPVPRQGRLAAIDFGTVRVGIAVCDPGQILASPLVNYDLRGKPQDESYYRKLFADEEIVGLVVGLPIHTGGEESQKSKEARQYGRWLGEISGLPVELFDERFSTRQARRNLERGGLSRKKRKQRLDMLAAQVILAEFLECRLS